MGEKLSDYREYNFAVAWVSQPTLSSRRAARLLPCDVRFGSLADIRERIRHVQKQTCSSSASMSAKCHGRSSQLDVVGIAHCQPKLAEKGVAFKVTDDPTIDTTSRTGKLVMGILALIAEFENDIRRERQMDGIAKARDRGVKFGRKPQLLPDLVKEIQSLRTEGVTVPQIMRQTKLSRASIYRALGRSDQQQD
jgi:Resolvase, N terminal domain